MQTYEERLARMKRYRECNREKVEEYRKAYRAKMKEKNRQAEAEQFDKHIGLIKEENEAYIANMPVSFGSFGKATYVIYGYRSSSVPMYKFTTTCRNTEECIEIMKKKFIERGNIKPKYLSVYKIMNGERKIVFREIIK